MNTIFVISAYLIAMEVEHSSRMRQMWDAIYGHVTIILYKRWQHYAHMHARVIARYMYCQKEWGFLNGVDIVKADQMKCMCCNIVKKCLNEIKWGFGMQMVIAIPKMGLQ